MIAKTVTAGVLALSLAGAPFGAAPARADADDAVRALLGFAALVAIAKELDDDPVKRNSRRSYWKGDNHWKGDVHHRHGRHKKHGRRHRDRLAVPGRCVVRMDSPRGAREVVLSHCLKRMGQYRDLPGYCAAPRATRLLGRKAYRLDCLRGAGYRVARRH